MNYARMILSLFYGFILLMNCFATYAETPSVNVLPEITIVASPNFSNEQTGVRELDEEDLSVAHERSIVDILDGHPGVATAKFGGYGLPSGILLRGANGQGMITLDGIPLFQSLPSAQNMDTLPVEALQKAEIERGPGSVQNSFQALGGAIRLYTKDSAKTGASFSLEGGSFGILRETAQASAKGKIGRMTVTLSRGDAFEGTHFAQAEENPERDRFRFTQGIVRFSSDLTERLNWHGTLLYRLANNGSDTLGADKNFNAAFLDDSRVFANRENWLAQSTLNANWTPSWQSRLQFGFNHQRTFSRLGTLPSGKPLQNQLLNRLYLVDWRNQHELVNDEKQRICWQLSWGGQARYETVKIQPNPALGFGFDSLGGFSEPETLNQPDDLIKRRTLASVFLETAGHYREFSGQAGVRIEHYDQYDDQPILQAAASWQLTPGFLLKASGGTGYRLPSYMEQFFLIIGNPNLQPERSASGEIALEWLPVSAMRVAVSGFYHRYDNLITTVYNSRLGPVAVNIADSDLTGGEFDIQYRWPDGLDSGLSYTYHHIQDLQSNSLIPLRPPHTARIWAQQKFTGLPVTLWAETIIRSSTWNDLTNTLPVKESLQLNASIRYAVSRQFEVYLRGENLTNNRNPQLYSIDTPGIAFYGGFKLEI